VIKPDRKTIQPLYDTNQIQNLGVCNWLMQEYFEILNIISLTLQCKFPDRKAKFLEIAAGCPIWGQVCEGNPAHSESGDTADFHYYTLGDTNHVQLGSPLVKIWDNPDTDAQPNQMFDIQRNVEFAILLRKVFPKAQIIMDQRIKDTLYYAADAAGRAFISPIQGDSPCHMNHHTHIHCYYKGAYEDGAVNWEAQI
jgi:hypothetical protein